MTAQPPRSGHRAREEPVSQGKYGNTIWGAVYVLASLAGGLAAGELTHESVGWAIGISLLIAAGTVAALMSGVLGDDRPEAGRSFQRPGAPMSPPPLGPPATQPQPGWPQASSGHAHGFTTPPGEPVQPGMVRLLQVERPASGGAWWEKSGGAAAQVAVSSRANERRPVDLSEFLGQAEIAQCPRCGSFRIDARTAAAEWQFRCQECGYQWAWLPGSPWPSVQSRPGLRG